MRSIRSKSKNKRISYSPSVEHHIKQCEIAGCLHPPVYSSNVLGWCKLCREVVEQEDGEVF